MERMRWDKIEKLTASKGIKKKQIAEAMGAHATRISDWISGKWQPDLGQALRLARFLSVPLDYLADDSMDELPTPDVLPEEMKLIEMARVVGIEEARRRLLQAPALDIEFVGMGRHTVAPPSAGRRRNSG